MSTEPTTPIRREPAIADSSGARSAAGGVRVPGVAGATSARLAPPAVTGGEPPAPASASGPANSPGRAEPDGASPARPAERAIGPGAVGSRDVFVRLNDYYEIYTEPSPAHAHAEAERCMKCGSAFCQPSSGYGAGCPLDNKIPEWNELVRLGRWREAYDRLDTTNNFPEFTSRVCPAPCQDACIHAINDEPVAIKSIERAIIERAFAEGWVVPRPPGQRTGRTVAVIGSGPAGLAAADQLNRAGHRVTVYEQADRPGGLLVYGVPNMKLDKGDVARRVGLLERAGIRFETGAAVGADLDPARLAADHDALLVAAGAKRGRDLPLPGRELAGVAMAMDYLEGSTRAAVFGQPLRHDGGRAGGLPRPLNAEGLDVVVIGGGDTGADCIATALRQGCRSVENITNNPKPPPGRDANHPWPGRTGAHKTDYAHTESIARFGADPRSFDIDVRGFLPDATGSRVAAVRIGRPNPADPAGPPEAVDLPAQLVVLAIGFTGHDADPIVGSLGLASERGRLVVEPGRHRVRGTGAAATPADRLIFAAGDTVSGPSLVVSAMADGRRAAAEIDAALARLA